MQQLLWCILVISATVSGLKDQRYQYEIKTFEVPVDHFSYTTNATFKIRYLINSRYSVDPNSPILFYPGNEANIELFAQNTGFMWEAASKLAATVIFAEHRYYGDSLPFGEQSFESPANLGHLTSEQALADYANLLDTINPQPKPPLNRRPVIAIGGSYAGRLAAWFRMKYPHIIAGAIASSAPIFQFKTPCDVFYRIVSSVFEMAYKGLCAPNIRHLWDVLIDLIDTSDGRQLLTDKFNFCDPEEVHDFTDYIDNALVELAMFNYPYATNFGVPLPAHPVREFCSRLSDKYDDDQLIDAFHHALQVYSNFSGTVKCLQFFNSEETLWKMAWRFQTCTEIIDPICTTGLKDIFMPSQWSLESHSDSCFQEFGVRPRENAIVTNFGGKRLEGASNIIFSNGLMDPWSGGGVLRTTNSLVQIVIIPEGAHHLDIRASNEKDPLSVRQARRFYLEMMKRWIKKHA